MKDFLWKLFTINTSSCLEDVKSNIQELKDYCSELKRISGSEEYCMHVWSDRLEKAFNVDYQNGKENGFEIGKEEGIKLGKEEGIKETQKSLITNFYNNGISTSVISKSTGLTIDEVESIINSNK